MVAANIQDAIQQTAGYHIQQIRTTEDNCLPGPVAQCTHWLLPAHLVLQYLA